MKKKKKKNITSSSNYLQPALSFFLHMKIPLESRYKITIHSCCSSVVSLRRIKTFQKISKNTQLYLITTRPEMPNDKSSTHLIAGFTGGLASAVSLQPLDLLKTRRQQTVGLSIASTIRSQPILSLWRGTVPSALRTSVGSGLYLTLLNSTRSYISFRQNGVNLENSSSKLPRLSSTLNLATGSFARATVGFITMPITIIKVRYESSIYSYSSLIEATRHIAKTEGVRGFFSGFGATTLRDAPYAGLYVLFYEKMKYGLSNAFSQGDKGLYSFKKSTMINLTSAVVSSSISTALTAPFDTVKTRMQLEPKKFAKFQKTVLYMLRNERSRLFDGLSLRLIRKGCSAGIAWCIYEELIKYF